MAVTFGNDINLDQYRVMNVGDPGAATDAVTRGYVDDALAELAAGLTWRDTVRVASTGNVGNLGAPGTIDGVGALAAGDRVLLKNQSDARTNGLYVVGAGGDLTRAGDPLRAGTAVFVSEGGQNGNKTYVLTTDDPITVGTTALTWAVINQGVAGAYTAGDGVTVSADRIISAVRGPRGTVDVTPAGIDVRVVANGGIDVAAGGLTATPYTAGDGVTVTGRVVAATAGPSGVIEVTPAGIDARLDPAGGLQINPAGLAVTAYTAGDGIDVTGRAVTAVAGDDGTIDVAADGIDVRYDPAGGLQVRPNGLAVVPYTAGDGVDVTNRVVTATAGPSGVIEVTPAGIDARLDPAGGLQINPAGLAVTAYTAGNGIDVTGRVVTAVAGGDATIDVAADGIDVRYDPAGGLEVRPAGLAVTPYTAGNGIDVTGRVVTAVAGGDATIDVSADGIDVRYDPAGGLQVRPNGLAVLPYTAGNGIDVTGRVVTATAGPSGVIAVTPTGIDARLDPAGGLVVNPAGLGVAGSRGLPLDMHSETVGNGTDTALAVRHGFGTRTVKVEVFATGSGETVTAQVVRTDADTVTVRFGRPPAAGEYTVMVIGRPATA